MTNFGKIMKKNRQGKITQEALAVSVGCTVKTIKNIENEHTKPGIELASRIAKRLGFSLDQL